MKDPFHLGLLVSFTWFLSISSFAEETDLHALFQERKALVDQNGQEIITRKGTGHPVPWDWNGDGKMDLILGCKANMNTALGELWLLENVGTSQSPKFKWPGELVKLEGESKCFSINCGCKTGGTYEVHPVDWNGDGHFDLLINTRSSTKEGCFLLLNTGKPGLIPSFQRGENFLKVKSHGRGSGAGDWNGDGVEDFVHEVNEKNWEVHFGEKKDGALKFSPSSKFTAKSYQMTPAPDGDVRWFVRTPCAWNFSGKNPLGSSIIEIIAPSDPQKNDADHPCKLNYYWLDHQTKSCTFKGTLVKEIQKEARVGMGDINGDGTMDVLYTGGVFSKGDETKIWVLFGKVQNIPR